MYRNKFLILLFVIVAIIDIAGITYLIKLQKENTELKALREIDYGFGKIYNVQKSTVDSIPNNTFYILKDNKTIRFNVEQPDGTIFKYDVFLSERNLTDSVLNEIAPILIDAFKKTEKEINEQFRK